VLAGWLIHGNLFVLERLSSPPHQDNMATFDFGMEYIAVDMNGWLLLGRSLILSVLAWLYIVGRGEGHGGPRDESYLQEGRSFCVRFSIVVDVLARMPATDSGI